MCVGRTVHPPPFCLRKVQKLIGTVCWGGEEKGSSHVAVCVCVGGGGGGRGEKGRCVIGYWVAGVGMLASNL